MKLKNQLQWLEQVADATMKLEKRLQWLGVTFYRPNEAEKPATMSRTGWSTPRRS